MPKIKNLGRKGKEVYSARSSRGDRFYSIYKEDDGKITCECIGFSTRKKCRHVNEYLDRQTKHKEQSEGSYKSDTSKMG